MEQEWFTPALHWADFSGYAALLSLLYLALRYFQRRIESGGIYFEEADHAVRSLMRVALLVVDPVIVLTLIALFVAVWPAVHGIIVGLVLLFAFHPVRDYALGYVLRFDHNVRIGKHIIAGDVRGVINGFGLTGLYVQLEEGRTRVSYHDLVKRGYTVAIDPSVSAYYHLLVRHLAGDEPNAQPELTSKESVKPEGKLPQRSLPPPENVESMSRRLRNRLVESPYVKRGFTITPPRWRRSRACARSRCRPSPGRSRPSPHPPAARGRL